MHLTEEQIFTLAPDEASKKAGRDLSNPSKWVSEGINELALWGECQGSGSKPYQTQVDLSNIAFKCSCPSRKFPCKHGLGLMLFYARNKSSFTDSAAPPWVEEWISKRADKEEKKIEKAEKPLDDTAKVKRVQAREQKVTDGIEELLLWIRDIIRNGILGIPEKGPAYWDNMARRMVDAQSGGLAAMVRNLGATAFWNDGWQSTFLDQLLQLYLVANGYQNIGRLNPLLQQDVRTAIGFPTNLEELKQQQGITDTWLVLARDVVEEDKLTVERNWLYGTQSNQYALVLQFYVRGQAGTLALTAGLAFKAELVFLPSAAPLRAVIKSEINISQQPVTSANALSGWQQVAELETGLNSALPFRYERPFIVHNLVPLQQNKQWWLMDEQQNITPIKSGFKSLYKLLAVSGGEPLTMAVLGRENEFEPIGVWRRQNYQAI